ncbi:MAG: TonB-dependent receptor [Candidatus Thiodiazotropha sp. (ex Ctena orbiculata)]|nr:TonB-dependent receptor [Candidatus Thiodiazotropha taylori]MBT3034959.1 TonB-dependent receptor [Candidatus Thiodiazotropha taylori]
MLDKKIDTMGITMQHCRNSTMLAKYSFIIFILAFSQQLFSGECAPVAQLVSLQGSVEKRSTGQDDWHQAQLDDQFCAGDAIRTNNDAKAAARLSNDTLLRLDANSSLTFSQVEKDSRSLLDLLRGAVHFMSRTPKSLEVKTPYVNASIEGTEFVIRIENEATDVIVLEGVVIARNTDGAVELGANQAARAPANQQPVMVAIAKPFDAVTWALYYPPLPDLPTEADTLARSAVQAIVQNRLEDAAELAKQALEKDSQSAAAYMAQSYVDQAMFDIPAALANSQRAAALAPESALTQARLAEVRLMTGNSRAAREDANRATSLNPKLSLAHTVLGFASLRDVNLDSAKRAFEEAITLDSAAPLPRLGLGLLKIRQGDLESGRQEIETAVLLDPSNALLRSYMGKAYYEENRNGLASQQFAMAKELDANDPTAWFYESILLQSENYPVEALHSQRQATELNSNRGVYRSRQLLDQDEAARNIASARIYTDLGFEKMAIADGAMALSQAPDNFSAHRFMADINATQPQRRLAVDSELLQSKLLQPLNAHTLRPKLSDLQLADGPTRLSYNEFNPLFIQAGPSLLLDGFLAGNDTWGEDLIVSYLHNRFSISLGQFHYESDGFGETGRLEKDTLTAFAQFNVTPETMLQIELTEDDQENGYLNQHFFPADFAIPDFTGDAERSEYRFGIRHQISVDSQIIGNVLRSENTFEQHFGTGFFSSLTLADDEIDNRELQWLNTFGDIKTVLGGSIIEADSETTTEFGYLEDIDKSNINQKYDRIYLYTYIPLGQTVNLTLGATYTNYEEIFELRTVPPVGDAIIFPTEKIDEDQINPKFGISWNALPTTTIRFSAFREGRRYDDDATLEPSQVSGFNQIYNDFSSDVVIDSNRYGLAIDHEINSMLYTGASVLHADLESSVITPTEQKTLDTEQQVAEAYVYYIPNNKINFKIELDYEDYQGQREAFAPNVLSLKTYRLPVGFKYRPFKDLTFELLATYYNQKGEYQILDEFFMPIEVEGNDDFWLFDGSLTYDLPKRMGKFSLGVKNLFDTSFNYEDRINNSVFLSSEKDTNLYELSQERIIYGKFILHFSS